MNLKNAMREQRVSSFGSWFVKYYALGFR